MYVRQFLKKHLEELIEKTVKIDEMVNSIETELVEIERKDEENKIQKKLLYDETDRQIKVLNNEKTSLLNDAKEIEEHLMNTKE